MTNEDTPAQVAKATGTGGKAVDKGLVGEIILPGTAEEQARQEQKVRSGFFSTLKRAFAHIPFAEDVVASYHCALDPQTPATSRGVLLAALAYFVLPFDVIPDMLVGIGFTDDMAVLLAAFTAVQKNIRPEHYAKARETLDKTTEDA